MHIKQLKKANSLLGRLEELDKEIIDIDKYAHLIKDQHLQISLKLSHKAPVSDKIYFDEVGSIKMDEFFMPYQIRINPHTGMFDVDDSPGSKKTKDVSCCELSVSEVIALQVLGVMVAHKEAERMSIINQLSGMGFKVSA